MAGPNNLITGILFLAFLCVAGGQYMTIDGGNGNYGWRAAHATFYGDFRGGETMQGACGYGDLFKQGYGLATAALSTALFKKGLTCGACFEIMCYNDPKWCYPRAGTIKITATNFCPPNYSKPDGNWCNPPLEHFDLSMYMFTKLANFRAGIIPVLYRRVRCHKLGGVKFEINGNPYWILVLIYNVGGAGDVVNVQIKGSKGPWIQMSRNWGQNWQAGAHDLIGQSLSFRVTTSDLKTLEFYNVAATNWQFGQTYDGKINF